MKCNKKNQRYSNRILYMQLVFYIRRVLYILIDILSKIRTEGNKCGLYNQRKETF
jgi:hypothetical protein